jgi:tripartite-type tricarboxylate transporter receptor subunit TctC
MGDKLGQQVIVENVTGAGGVIAIRTVKAAAPDGYTLLAVVNTVVIQQAMRQDPGYDVARDFTGIGAMTRSPFLLVTAASQSYNSVPEMLARARSNPGGLSYASAGSGSTTHLAAALFAQQAAAPLLHVPYKGNAAAWPDLIAGRVDMLFEGVGGGTAMIREGRLKAVGVTSTKRLDSLPDVPTIAEQGVPNYSFYFWGGLFAPAATPNEVVQALSAALRGALSRPELMKRFRDEGSEVMLTSPEEFTRFVRNEAIATAKLVADLRLPKE